MTVNEDDFRRCRELIAPWGNRRLQVDPDPKRLVDGLYIVSKAVQGKWVISIYRNVKNPANDLEMAIDVKALVYPDSAEHQRALIWLENQKLELQHEESPSHITDQRIEAFRIGFKTINAHTFLKLLETQLNHTQREEKWAIKVVATPQSTQLLPPSHENEVASQPSRRELAVNRMLEMAYQAEKQSGSESITVAKTKEVRFASKSEFFAHVAELMSSGQCAITKIILDESMQDPELMPSLDRIDSSKHYEPGNLQVVARFVNRWKSDDNAANFARLIELVQRP